MPKAERTSGTRSDRRTATRRRTPPPTVILLVRHGTTTTTGKELPGRAPGLHLADSGRAQAGAVAARIAALVPGKDADGGDTTARSNGRKAGPGKRAGRRGFIFECRRMLRAHAFPALSRS